MTDESEKSGKLSYLDRMLKESETFRTMQGLLGQYILLEQYFMAQSVQKVPTSSHTNLQSPQVKRSQFLIFIHDY